MACDIANQWLCRLQTTNATEIDLLKIVIVEDDRFYGEILRKYVSQVAESFFPPENSFVKHYLSAEECIKHLDPETHLFVLDYNLANGERDTTTNGLELLKLVKKECPHARTIVVTHDRDYTTINQFNMLGADRYILKDGQTSLRIMSALKQLLNKPLTV